MEKLNTKAIAYLEDDLLQSTRVSKWLTNHGYTCSAFDNANAIQAAFKAHQFDAIILDWQLDSGSSGLDVLEYFRQHHSADTPVVFLSSKTDSNDINTVLNAGADDFLSKPVNQKELIGVLEAYLKPAAISEDPDTPEFAPYLFDTQLARLSFNGLPVELNASEFAVVAHLFSHNGQTVSKQTLLSLIAEHAELTETVRIESFIHKLKKTINLRASIRWRIESVHGFGFRLSEIKQTPHSV